MATFLSKAERSYIVSGLTARLGASIRQDGRDVHDYRTIGVMTGDGVAPLANGSAKVSVGGTEVVAAVRLEVGDTISYSNGGSMGNDEGRIRCNVTCSPAAYPHLSSNQQDDIQNDLTSLLQSVYSRPTPPHPPSSSSSSLSVWDHLESNLLILSTGKTRKYWTLHLDAVVLSDAGNLYDVLFLACRGALWDTRVPRTRAVEYRHHHHQRQQDDKGEEEEGGRDLWKEAIRSTHKNKRGGGGGAADFELEDPSELGRWLIGRERCPVAVTLNILPTAHLVDATHAEEQAVPLKLVLLYSFTNNDDRDQQKAASSSSSSFLGMRLMGPGQVPLEYLKGLLQQGETYAQQLVVAFDAQLMALERSRE